ncbi:unnamed protein product [Caenorhabditis angaria]|uniref:Autophagy-related protein 6 n=1 Tax=Caenorhabditis angaria TaxID=860376 RepID=A0A9P1N592_9PELO|nr:unnamed protein product [Caenorhabditis angaria]
MGEPRLFICLNCQVPLRLELAQRRPESADPEKKNENDIYDSFSGTSLNLLRLLGDAQFPSDAPICRECSDALLKEMDVKLASLEDECSSYRKYIEFLKENHPSSNVPELKTQLKNLEDEEKSLEAQLAKLLQEEEQLDNELQDKKRQTETMSKEAVDLWKTYRDNLRKVIETQDEVTSLEAEYHYADMQHRKLIETNVLDLCFHIWIEDKIGEINGFRLGYLKETPIEWVEINAGLGQIVLLIEILFERLKISHHELTPVAMGSHSYIKYRRNGTEEKYAMYGQGTPFTGTSNIDRGMKKFLELMDFLHRSLLDRDPKFKAAFKVHSDGLVDNGVKYNSVMMLNTDVRWSRSMIMLLMNLKTACMQVDSLRVA